MREKHTKTLQVKQEPYGYYWTKYSFIIKHNRITAPCELPNKAWISEPDRVPVRFVLCRITYAIRGDHCGLLMITYQEPTEPHHCPYFDTCLDKTILFKVFYAFVLLFDVTIAQNYGPWSNMYTNRGPRPNYQDTAIRANSKRSTVPKRRSFTDVQKEALKSEVMCDVFETLNESRKQSAMMADKQRALEELEERIQDCFKIIKCLFSIGWIMIQR